MGGDISYRTAVLLNSGGLFTRILTSPTYDPAEARVFDYDGDGRTELMLFSDDSWRVLRGTGADFLDIDTGIGEGILKLADLNADGLQDAVVDSGGTIKIRQNLGGAFGGLFPTSYDAANLPYAQVIDFNSDGRQDLFLPYSGGVWHALLAWKAGDNFDRFGTLIADAGFDDRPQVGDCNGDSMLDVALAINGKWTLLLHKAGVPNLMTSINPGDRRYEDLITINYQPLTNSGYKPFGNITPLYNMGSRLQCPSAFMCNVRGVMAPMYVTASYQKNTGIPGAGGVLGARTYSYAYENARVDISGRGFLGFGRQTVRDDVTSIYTTSNYLRDFPFTGLLDSSETRLNNPTIGRLLSSVGNGYARILTTANDTAPAFPYLRSSTNTQGDLKSGALLATTTTTNTSDDWGNFELITVDIKDALGSLVHSTRTVNQYEPPIWSPGASAASRAAP